MRIFRAAKGQNERRSANHSVGVLWCDEDADPREIAAESSCEAVHIRFRTLRQKMESFVLGNQVGVVLFTERRASFGNSDLGEGKKAQLFGVRIQSFQVHVVEIGFGVEEVVAENDRAKFANAISEVLVRIVRGREFLYFFDEFWINWFSTFLACLKFTPKSADWRGALVRFAKRNVEGRDLRVIFMQDVKQLCEVGARERPLAEDFLRVLVNIHDNDVWINRSCILRAIAEARIERIVFKTLEEIENGRGVFAEKREVVKGKRAKSDAEAD